MAEYRCPRCHSLRVKVSYPDLECLSCGWNETLIDYPISWNEHRRNCLEFGRPDPGSNIPPEHTIDELHEQLTALENAQPLEKPKVTVTHYHEKPKPRLRGVEL